MIRAKMDSSGFLRRVARIRRAQPDAEHAAVRALAGQVVEDIMDMAPRDTNRYARGWALAAKAAGVGSVTVPNIEPSKRNEWLVDRLDLQVAQWDARLAKAQERHAQMERTYHDRYTSIGRYDKWERDMRQKVTAAAKRVEKTKALRDRATEALEAIKADPHALVIWGKRSKNDLAKGQISTVRTKLYGGTGKVERIGDRTIVVLHNLEPHASIVETNKRVVARALARARGTGIRKMGRKYVETLKRKAA
jgi:chromosome segregation ATPase